MLFAQMYVVELNMYGIMNRIKQLQISINVLERIPTDMRKRIFLKIFSSRGFVCFVFGYQLW